MNQPNILIVDDEADIRELLAELLADLGNISCAENGSHALQLLDESAFDVIISDYNMPGLNGLELLKTIRERNNATPLIWITGNSTEQLMNDARRIGVFDYIEKPFDIERVRLQVEAALKLNSASKNTDNKTTLSDAKPFHQLSLELEHSLFESLRFASLRVGMSMTSYLTKILKEELESQYGSSEKNRDK